MPRTLITGGAGFIGSHLCERLFREGHSVICIDNLSTGSLDNIKQIESDRFRFIKHNVTEYIDIPGQLDYVLHFASPASPKDYFNMPIQTLKVGSLGTHNALGVAKAKRAVFMLASTSEVYGDPEVHPQPETYWGNVNPVGYRSVYDEAKRFAEAIALAYHRYHKIPVRIARIFNTYGPRMRIDDGRVVPNFIKQALNNQALTVHSDGNQTRSFCYIDDLIEGLYRLMISDINEPVNLGNDKEIKIIEFARLILKITGQKENIIYKERLPDDPKRRCPDISLACKQLGWSPVTDLEEGLSRTISWFKESKR